MFSTNEELPFQLTFYPVTPGQQGGVLPGKQPNFPAQSQECAKTSGALLLKLQGVQRLPWELIKTLAIIPSILDSVSQGWDLRTCVSLISSQGRNEPALDITN